MRYEVRRAADVIHDLEAIFDHLVESYVGFGESREEALDRAALRIARIDQAITALGRQPHQGTLREAILPGVRSVTKDRAIFYFDVDDEAYLVRVLAVFFGGQDHQRAMLKRVMGAKKS